jgi:hypothetical protein
MGVQAFLYESLHGRYPDFPLATHFKQKHTQKSTFQLPTPITTVPRELLMYLATNCESKYNRINKQLIYDLT